MKITKRFLYLVCATATIWILYSLFLSELRGHNISAVEEYDDNISWV